MQDLMDLKSVYQQSLSDMDYNRLTDVGGKVRSVFERNTVDDKVKCGVYYLRYQLYDELILLPRDNALYARYYRYSHKFKTGFVDSRGLLKTATESDDLVRWVRGDNIEQVLAEQWCREPMVQFMYRLKSHPDFAIYLEMFKSV
jgi:hypothetical protein